MNTVTDRTLRLERIIRAPVEDVFDAWIVPEKIAGWWGPEYVTIPEYSIDARPGGKWRTVMQQPTGNKVEVSSSKRTNGSYFPGHGLKKTVRAGTKPRSPSRSSVSARTRNSRSSSPSSSKPSTATGTEKAGRLHSIDSNSM